MTHHFGDRTVGVCTKIERAKEHIRDLESPIGRFEQVVSDGVVAYDESDTGDRVFVARVPEQPPPRWSAIIGDAVHNLRSVLDLLVCELVRVHSGPSAVTEQTGFPVNRDANGFKSGYHTKVDGAPNDAVRLIKELKPYKGGNDTLWTLHRLDILDKHRLLLTAVTRHMITVSHYKPRGDDVLFSAWKRYRAAHWEGMVERKSLEDGVEIDRIPARFRPHVDVDTEFAFHVTFSESEVVEGEAVIPTLYQLADFVEGTVEAFLPFLNQR